MRRLCPRFPKEQAMDAVLKGPPRSPPRQREQPPTMPLFLRSLAVASSCTVVRRKSLALRKAQCVERNGDSDSSSWSEPGGRKDRRDRVTPASSVKLQGPIWEILEVSRTKNLCPDQRLRRECHFLPVSAGEWSESRLRAQRQLGRGERWVWPGMGERTVLQAAGSQQGPCRGEGQEVLASQTCTASVVTPLGLLTQSSGSLEEKCLRVQKRCFQTFPGGG